MLRDHRVFVVSTNLLLIATYHTQQYLFSFLPLWLKTKPTDMQMALSDLSHRAYRLMAVVF
jgi:hypothetical protein